MDRQDGRVDATAKSPQRQRCVLYVDHDAGNRLVFEHGVSERFDVLTAESCEAALHLLEREDISLIVTEERMPAMTGSELLRHIRGEYPGLAGVVVSATDVPEVVTTGTAVSCIVKPWDVEQLVATLERAVALRDATLSEAQSAVSQPDDLLVGGGGVDKETLPEARDAGPEVLDDVEMSSTVGWAAADR